MPLNMFDPLWYNITLLYICDPPTQWNNSVSVPRPFTGRPTVSIQPHGLPTPILRMVWRHIIRENICAGQECQDLFWSCKKNRSHGCPTQSPLRKYDILPWTFALHTVPLLLRLSRLGLCLSTGSGKQYLTPPHFPYRDTVLFPYVLTILYDMPDLGKKTQPVIYFAISSQ